MTESELREAMERGDMYDDLAEPLFNRRKVAMELQTEYNSSYGEPHAEREKILKKLFKSVGKNVHFERDLYVEFGFNVTLGDNFYGNIGMIFLDGASVTIGNDVYVGPRCGVYATNHAFDKDERSANGVFSKPITIGDNVWIGGNVSICQGVNIGSGSIIGAGSVVTKDIPENVIAAGNPCKVIREITDKDKTGYVKENNIKSY